MLCEKHISPFLLPLLSFVNIYCDKSRLWYIVTNHMNLCTGYCIKYWYGLIEHLFIGMNFISALKMSVQYWIDLLFFGCSDYKKGTFNTLTFFLVNFNEFSKLLLILVDFIMKLNFCTKQWMSELLSKNESFFFFSERYI